MALIFSVTTKGPDYFEGYWTPVQGASEYRMYISRTDITANFVSLKTGISNEVNPQPPFHGRISTRIPLSLVRTALANATLDFVSSYVYYIRITSVTGGIESALASAQTKYLGPIGIGDPYSLDLETGNAHPSNFSDALQRWVRAAGTRYGALNTSENPLMADNLTVDKTIGTVGGTKVVLTELWYYTGSPSGSRAKLITYTYGADPIPTKTVWSESVVP